MGTINYKTSDYITIGYKLNDVEQYDDDYFYFEQEDFEIAQEILKDYYFYYFHVTIKPGYYAGFYIDIECNFNRCFDCWQDKQESQKEITLIKQFLVKIIESCNCCVVAPGWCTTYYNYKDSLIKLNQAIKEMREHVKRIPTYYKLKAAGEI